MDRDASLKEIRMQLELEVLSDKTQEELFMHLTLRPILKFQNDLIMQLIRSSKQINFDLLDGKQKNESEKRAYFTSWLQKNSKLKAVLIGSIVGLFNQEELANYLNQHKEIDKRITEMIITRFISQMESA